MLVLEHIDDVKALLAPTELDLAVPAIDPVTGSRVTLFNELPQYLGTDKHLETNPSDFKTKFVDEAPTSNAEITCMPASRIISPTP